MFAVKSLQSEEPHTHLGSQAAKWWWKEKPLFGVLNIPPKEVSSEQKAWAEILPTGADWEDTGLRKIRGC